MTDRDIPRFVAPTIVKQGREAEFEELVTDVIVPAVERIRPHLRGMWQTLRPADVSSGGVARAYVFVFYADAPLDDWELDTLFTSAFGAEEGERRIRQLDDLIESQTIYAIDGALPR